jgi:hypothetical protein
VTGAATDARKTPVTTRHAARTPELTSGAATDARHATLPAGTATGTHVLATGAAVTVGVAAAPAWILLEDQLRGRRTGRRASRESFSCPHRRNSNRCSNSATDHQRFDQIQFR